MVAKYIDEEELRHSLARKYHICAKCQIRSGKATHAASAGGGGVTVGRKGCDCAYHSCAFASVIILLFSSWEGDSSAACSSKASSSSE